MSLYGKFISRAFVGSNSDYSMPDEDTRTTELAITPTLYVRQRMHLSTAAQTLDLSPFTTITGMLIVNHSSTAAETVDAQWHYLKSSIASGSYVFSDIATGDYCLKALGGFTAAKAVEGDYVRITNSDTRIAGGTNDGVFIIASCNDILLVTIPGGAWSLEAATPDTNAVLAFERRNIQQIVAGGQLLVTGAIQPAADLILTANSGTPEVTVFVTGT